MKYILLGTLGIFASLLIAYLLMIQFNKSILRSSLPKPIKFFIQTFIPPEDLYLPIIRQQVDFSQEKFNAKSDFILKYPGRYSLGIFLENIPSDFYFNKKAQHFTSSIAVNFLVKEKKVKSIVLGGQYSPFLGKDGSGLIFYTFSSPKDLSLNELISCEIDLIKSDSQFNDTYGPIYFFVKKMSDK